MVSRLLSLGKVWMVCALALLATSPAQAQTSPSGHVPARTAYPHSAPTPFSIYPGDHMFQATMKIEHGYQYAKRIARLPATHRPAMPLVVRQEETQMEVSFNEPEETTEMVAIRGPNGEVRSFPIVGGRQAIKARTIIVRPGQSINLLVQGGNVVVSRK